jgi:hypothetical protein
VDWRGRYERAAARYAAGEMRELDERQLVQLANAAWAAGLSLLTAGDREEAAVWLRRSAERYRESWDAGAGTDAWGRQIGAMKGLGGRKISDGTRRPAAIDPGWADDDERSGESGGGGTVARQGRTTWPLSTRSTRSS